MLNIAARDLHRTLNPNTPLLTFAEVDTYVENTLQQIYPKVGNMVNTLSLRDLITSGVMVSDFGMTFRAIRIEFLRWLTARGANQMHLQAKYTTIDESSVLEGMFQGILLF